MRLLRFIAIFLALAPCRAASNWVKVSTPNFEVYTDAGEKRGKDVLRHFETLRSFFAKLKIAGTTRTEAVHYCVPKRE